ncbi:hypothetical protein MNBD_GAMMA06-594 [hydrothermal vent metagenome]|uniref:Glutamine amidotransferase type-2 domain-containing protein n=1 Tax=hydrothermal vent metagenome TaxID=652676 RepID=A0A3B0XFL5_9ZZZZ
MEPNSFLISIGFGDVSNMICQKPSYENGSVTFFSSIQTDRLMSSQANADGFGVYIGDRLHATPDYLTRVIESGWDAEKDNGVLVKYSEESGTLVIDSDFLGAEYVYYYLDGKECLISNRMENMTKIKSFSPDLTGIYQYIRAIYSVGDRTFLEGVKQTRAQTSLSINTKALTVSSQHSASWKVAKDKEYSKQSMAELWLQTLEESPRSVLMLSAGWDSRMLLAGNLGRFDFSYTHGELDSREVSLAFELTSENLPKSVFCKLDESSYTLDTMNRMLKDLGHAFFPHWYFAAQQCKLLSDAPLTSGLLVEHLSGHYGITSEGSRLSKGLKLLKSLGAASKLEKMSPDAINSYIVEMLKAPAVHKGWFYSDGFLDSYEEIKSTHSNDVALAIQGYQKQGTAGLQEVFERFKMEHSSRQYFALQTKCGNTANGYHHPFADSRLSKAVIEIPFKNRVHYKLSRDIVGVLAPDLLSKPLAATLAKAKHPVVVQEMSRVVRIAYEGIYRRFKPNASFKLSWNNFQFLNELDIFNETIDSLRSDIWDKSQMHKFVEGFQRGKGNGYALLDMFSKIMTIDNIISPKN